MAVYRRITVALHASGKGGGVVVASNAGFGIR